MKSKKVFESDGKRIDLSRVTRMYPAALISAGGEQASVSLEWAESKADKVILEAFVLVCDFDPVGELPVNRVELHYQTQEELLSAMQTIALLLKEE